MRHAPPPPPARARRARIPSPVHPVPVQAPGWVPQHLDGWGRGEIALGEGPSWYGLGGHASGPISIASVRLGRLDPSALLELLASPHLQGWWLARDASAALLKARPEHCLAHWIGAGADEMSEAMAATKLFQNGSSAAAREKSIGVQLTTVRVKHRGERVNFLWLGAPPVDPVRPPRWPTSSPPPPRRILARPQRWSCGSAAPSPFLAHARRCRCAGGRVGHGAARRPQRPVPVRASARGAAHPAARDARAGAARQPLPRPPERQVRLLRIRSLRSRRPDQPPSYAARPRTLPTNDKQPPPPARRFPDGARDPVAQAAPPRPRPAG